MTYPEITKLLNSLTKETKYISTSLFNSLKDRLLNTTYKQSNSILKEFFNEFNSAIETLILSSISKAVDSKDIRIKFTDELKVSNLTLSKALYKNSNEVTKSVKSVLRQHFKTLESADKLALKIYQGYGFNDKEVLNVKKKIPKYLLKDIQKILGSNSRNEAKKILDKSLAKVIKTKALKTSYLEALRTAIKSGVSKDLTKKLDIVLNERSRYFANRIAQYETYRAYSYEANLKYLQDDTIEVVKYKISLKHLKPDICDMWAYSDMYGLGTGVYPKELAPFTPLHSFCRCRTIRTTISRPPEIKNPVNGMNSYMNSLDLKGKRDILGSYGKVEEWQKGKSPLDIWNKNIPNEYKIKTVGEKLGN